MAAGVDSARLMRSLDAADTLIGGPLLRPYDRRANLCDMAVKKVYFCKVKRMERKANDVVKH